MRKQAVNSKKRQQKLQCHKQQRSQAVPTIENRNPMRQSANVTEMLFFAFAQLSQQMKLSMSVNQIQATDENIPMISRSTVLLNMKNRLLSAVSKFSAKRGFSIDVVILNHTATKSARADGKPFCTVHPASDSVRAFRVHHADMDLRRVEHKDAAKIFAEHFQHAALFVKALNECKRQYLGMLDDPERVFSLENEKKVN